MQLTNDLARSAEHIHHMLCAMCCVDISKFRDDPQISQLGILQS